MVVVKSEERRQLNSTKDGKLVHSDREGFHQPDRPGRFEDNSAPSSHALKAIHRRHQMRVGALGRQQDDGSDEFLGGNQPTDDIRGFVDKKDVARDLVFFVRDVESPPVDHVPHHGLPQQFYTLVIIFKAEQGDGDGFRPGLDDLARNFSPFYEGYVHDQTDLSADSLRAPDLDFATQTGSDRVDDGKAKTGASLQGILLGEGLEHLILRQDNMLVEEVGRGSFRRV